MKYHFGKEGWVPSSGRAPVPFRPKWQACGNNKISHFHDSARATPSKPFMGNASESFINVFFENVRKVKPKEQSFPMIDS